MDAFSFSIMKRPACSKYSSRLLDGPAVLGRKPLLGEEVHHLLDFGIRNKSALYTLWLREACRIKEHVALSEQLFRTIHVNDRAGIHTG